MNFTKRASPIAFAVVIVAVACTNSGANEPTATPIRSAPVPTVRSTGVFHISDDLVLWVTSSDEIVIAAEEVEKAHPYTLAGQRITFVGPGDAAGSESSAVVSGDESVVAVPVQTSAGSAGVALVRGDGYKMALHIYGNSNESIGSIKFMPEFGLTLLSLGNEAGGRIIAVNNYGMLQFELPVRDFLGTLRYSPDELRYMVIDRRPLEQELELVPFAEPGESTLFRAGGPSEEGDELFRSLEAVISNWQ